MRRRPLAPLVVLALLPLLLPSAGATTVMVITSNAMPEVPLGWDRGGLHILFSRGDALYVSEAYGYGAHRFAPGAASGVVDPAGTRVAYVVPAQGGPEATLRVKPLAGGNETVLALVPQAVGTVAWSPGGDGLLFTLPCTNNCDVSGGPGADQVWWVGADGQGAHMVVQGRHAQFSPGGQSILFIRRVWDDGWIYRGASVATLDGGVQDLEATALWAAWSPRGNTMALVSAGASGFRLSLAGPAAQDTKTLADGLANPCCPVWASDGRSLAYVGNDPRASLWIVGMAGAPRVLGPQGSEATWSPDGSRLAFVANGSLWVGDSRGMGAVPYSSQATHPVWRPDGNTLAYTRQGNVALLMLGNTPRLEVKIIDPYGLPVNGTARITNAQGLTLLAGTVAGIRGLNLPEDSYTVQAWAQGSYLGQQGPLELSADRGVTFVAVPGLPSGGDAGADLETRMAEAEDLYLRLPTQFLLADDGARVAQGRDRLAIAQDLLDRGDHPNALAAVDDALALGRSALEGEVTEAVRLRGAAEGSLLRIPVVPITAEGQALRERAIEDYHRGLEALNATAYYASGTAFRDSIEAAIGAVAAEAAPRAGGVDPWIPLAALAVGGTAVLGLLWRRRLLGSRGRAP